MCSSESDEEEDIDELYERATQGEIDLDDTMASADRSSTVDDMCSSESDEEEDIDELHERATQGEIDLDEIMVSDDESSTDDDMCSSESDEEEDIEELYERATQGEIDLDEIMVSAARAGKREGVDPTHLSKKDSGAYTRGCFPEQQADRRRSPMDRRAWTCGH
jgi:hypothetical protein